MRHLIPLTLAALLLSCAGRPPAPSPACQRVPHLPGPEDLVLDLAARPPRLLVSSQQRWQGDDGVPLPDGRIAALELTAQGLGPARALPLRNRDDAPFHPHGVDLWTTATGERRLWVINHVDAAHHVIEEFGVQDDGLVFRRRLQDPLLRSPNDLVAAGDDELYVANDRGLPQAWMVVEATLSLPLGSVLHYRGGTWRTVADGVAYPAGIALDASREQLYVAATRERRVRVYPRDPQSGALGPLARVLDVGSGVDNLTWQDPRTLLVAAHPDVIAFARHAAGAALTAPSQVWAVDVLDGRARLLLDDDGDRVAAASVAWRLGSRLVMGQVFADGVVSCPLP